MRLALTLAAGIALATPALAQDYYYGAPSYQRGSGTRAGGPANELNSNWGPAYTGSVHRRRAPRVVVPDDYDYGYYEYPSFGAPMPSGKGNYAGGYRGEMMRREGAPW